MSIVADTFPIRTQRQRVPWSWVLMMSLPVAMSAFVEKCSGTAMTFTLRKFISDPSLIMLLTSVNIAFGVLVAPWVAWKSDGTWTRLGRRKPFLLAGLLLLAGCLVCMPLATSLWLLVPIILLYQFSMDVGYTGPWDPLYFDVVPDAQRGRGMVINRYVSFAARLVFMYVLIGRFDESIGLNKLTMGLAGESSFHLTGEQLIYFLAAALVLATVVFVGFAVRETPPSVSIPADVKPARSAPSFRRFWKDLYGTKEKRLLCLPVIASVLMAAKLASLQPLLYTEQFGYSKQAMGNFHSISMLVNAALVLPIVALIVDRYCRLRIFLFCLVASTILPIAFWVYVKYFAHLGVPSPRTIIGFHIADAAFDHAGMLALWPMVFRATRCENRGQTAAAFLIVTGVVHFVSNNLLGLWVKGYSAVTCSAGVYDYMSGYLYIFFVGILACVASFYYAAKRTPSPNLPEPGQ